MPLLIPDVHAPGSAVTVPPVPAVPAASRLLRGARLGAATGGVLLFVAFDLACVPCTPFSVTGWGKPTLVVAVLLALALFYRAVRPKPPLAELPAYGALWVVLSASGVICTYCAARLALPLQDAALASFDAWAGFDWVAWTQAVRARPVLNLVLRLAYDSLTLQIPGTLVLLALARVRGRNEELLLATVVSLLLTVAVAALLPAAGPWKHFGYGALEPAGSPYLPSGALALPHFLELRRGAEAAFALEEMQGIITFPSFHTVLAVLFVHAHRGLRWSLPPVAALNALMLASVPSEGGHYLADMAAGGVIAVATLVFVRAVLRRGQPGSA